MRGFRVPAPLGASSRRFQWAAEEAEFGSASLTELSCFGRGATVAAVFICFRLRFSFVRRGLPWLAVVRSLWISGVAVSQLCGQIQIVGLVVSWETGATAGSGRCWEVDSF